MVARTINDRPYLWLPCLDLNETPQQSLPRILAFHGGGTNPQIFRLQCRALSKALQDNFRFVYVRAPYTSQPGPDVTTHFKDKPPFLA